jgi:hypothetical protein
MGRRVLAMGRPNMKAWIALAILGLALRSAAARAEDFVLDISGSPALLVKVDCRVVDGGEAKRLKFRAYVPARYLLQYGAVSCIVQKWDQRGRLRVSLLEGSDVIAFAETAAAYNYVTVRSAGPWGKAAGVRGAIPFPLSSGQGTNSRSTSPAIPGSVAPLNPPLVPPLNVPTSPPTTP